jgi:hypothetical protein
MMKKDKIPDTDSIEELARFWDTHDLTDYEDEMQEVTDLVVERPLGMVLRIRLDPQEAQAVETLAKAKGKDEVALVREWVLERIHEEHG